MSIGVVLAGPVVAVARNRLVRREPFEPDGVIGVQPAFVVVDEDGCGDVHGVDQRKTLLNAALLQRGLDLRGDVEKRPPTRRFEPKLLPVRLHRAYLLAVNEAESRAILRRDRIVTALSPRRGAGVHRFSLNRCEPAQVSNGVGRGTAALHSAHAGVRPCEVCTVIIRWGECSRSSFKDPKLCVARSPFAAIVQPVALESPASALCRPLNAGVRPISRLAWEP